MCSEKRKKSPSLSPGKLSERLREIGADADSIGVRAYLVGGAVRDLLLGIKHLDWDIVVEGNTGALVRHLGQRLHAGITAHPRFGTFVLTLPDGTHIDMVTARKENYPRPGILPVVRFSNLRDDLYRRDFTVNALALALNGCRCGEMVDYYGGLADLKKRRLRVLHGRSFRDDPTRIFRLARFAGRGFSIDPRTGKQAAEGKKYLRYLSDERVREELLAILSEKDPLPALQLLEKWGILQKVLPGARLPGKKELRAARHKGGRLHALIKNLPDARYKELLQKLKLSRALRGEVEAMRRLKNPVPVISGGDLIAMGYTPGPLFGKILGAVCKHRCKTPRQARRFVFDKFPQKI